MLKLGFLRFGISCGKILAAAEAATFPGEWPSGKATDFERPREWEGESIPPLWRNGKSTS
jgi:hypothetical protein